MSQQSPGPAGPPPYGAPVTAAPPSSSKATASLVLGIVSLVLCGFVSGIPAMILGRQAKREIRESRGQLSGDGLATAGFVTGLLGTLWTGFVTLLVVGVFLFGGALKGAFEPTCPDGSTPTAQGTC